MGSRAQDRVIQEFELVAGGGEWSKSTITAGVIVSERSTGVAEALGEVAEQIQTLAVASQQQKDAAGSNTQAVLTSGVQTVVGGAMKSTASGGGGVGGAFATAAKTVFKSGLGLSPLISGIISLFGGGDSEEHEPRLVRYTPPPAVAFRAANTKAGIADADYGPGGAVRAYTGESSVRLSTVRHTLRDGAAASAAPEAGGGPQINIQVHAMDSRSFLDHSAEIAQAVREAMLNMHALNDVVVDL